MATSLTTGTFSSLYKSIISEPGATPNPASVLTPAAQAYTVDPNRYQPPAGGTQALQLKSEGQYSNKQFVAPFKYEINVEGTWVTVDALGKKIITETENQYKSIASLSAIKFDIKIIDQARLSGGQRAVKNPPSSSQNVVESGNATFNSAAQLFNTGTNSTVNTIGKRFTEYSSLLQSNTKQVFSNITSSFGGTLNNIIPTTQINQSIAKIPGLSVVTNAFGNLPGGTNLTSVLSNPLGSVEGIVGNTVQGLNLQAALPSVDLGSLTDVFSTATDIFHNGPPTSLEGIIALEKQIKGIVCNFQLPNITLPDWDTITSFKFPKPEDIIKQIKKSVEDEIANVINKLDIREQLKQLLEQFDPKKIYEAVIKELTTCDNSPNAEQNAKSGQPGNG
jgi:hypothetical protein